jgi:phosphopantetheinyl transferase
VDIEYIGKGQEGLEMLALSSEEKTLLSGLSHAGREEWLTRLWCAKEAVAKALGFGMAGGPWNLEVREVDFETGEVNVEITGRLARQIPRFADRPLEAYTDCEDDLAFATSLVRGSCE